MFIGGILMGRTFAVALLLALYLVPLAFAATSALTTVRDAVMGLYCDLKTLLPVAVMLMIVLAGVIYAAGQMMGAETRARANVWATACLTGAIIGLLIVVIAPTIMNQLTATGAGGVAAC